MSEHADAELVAGVLAGNRSAFAAVYDRYADRLYDFCFALLRDRHEAADAVHDTFVVVAQRLNQLKDPERLRPWLYAVARSVALAKIRAGKRLVLDEADEMADPSVGPHRSVEQDELRDLVWGAAAGLSERDQSLLTLHLRHGLEGAELGEALGVSANNAHVQLSRLRDQVERSLGAFLIARLGKDDCDELGELLADWDGKFSPIVRKRVARHVDSCKVCGDRRKVMVSPWALLATVPVISAPLLLRERVVGTVDLVAYSPPSTKYRKVAAGAGAAAVLVGLGAAIALSPNGSDKPAIPVAAEVTSTRGLAIDRTPPLIEYQATSETVIYTGDCGPTVAPVRVSIAKVGSVRLTWTDPVGVPGTVDMVWGPENWTASLGPFADTGTVTWNVEAFDAAGNRAVGHERSLEVAECAAPELIPAPEPELQPEPAPAPPPPPATTAPPTTEPAPPPTPRPRPTGPPSIGVPPTSPIPG